MQKYRTIFDPARSGWTEAAIVHRENFQPGMRITGPVAIPEETTTIIVPGGRVARCQPDGCIEITPGTGETT